VQGDCDEMTRGDAFFLWKIENFLRKQGKQSFRYADSQWQELNPIKEINELY
jgi:hypothetical protein